MENAGGPFSQIYCFDRFTLDLHRGRLLGAEGEEIPLRPKSFALLRTFVESAGKLLDRDAIMAAVWPGVFVTDESIAQCIKDVRRALSDDEQRLIRTVVKRGYVLNAEVTTKNAEGNRIQTNSAAESVQKKQLGALVSARVSRIFGALVALPIRSGARIAAAGVVILAAALALLAAGGSTPGPKPIAEPAQSPAPDRTIATSAIASTPTPADRTRVAMVVLPFNKSGVGVDQDTVARITENLTVDLSQFPHLLVIAGSAALAHTEGPIDIGRIGRELGVRYAVQGSVHLSDGKPQVSAQLLSIETGEAVWAERFDIGREGERQTMDDVVRQIAFMTTFRAIDAEGARSLRERPDNPDVADLLARARWVYNRPPGPERQGQLLALYERAVELDPASPAALSGLAEAIIESLPVWTIWNDDPTAPEKFRRADALITRAEMQSPHDRHVMLARLLWLGRQRQCPEVIPVARRTMELHPTLTATHNLLGICLLRDGKAAEAVAKFEDSIRVHPRNPAVDSRYRLIGYSLLFLGRYDEAVSDFRTALGLNPSAGRQTRGNDYAAIAAAQALAGDIAAARMSAAEAVRLWPTITVRSYYPFNITNPVAVAQVARMRDGLRLAGIRDHADEDADPGLPADNVLHSVYEAPTPIGAPGVRTIRTPDLVELRERQKPLVLDMTPWGGTIPGAVGLWGAGIGGSRSDEFQERLRTKMAQLTGKDPTVPLVTVGWNAERYQSRNLALRLAALGYTEVYWYRGGREAWMAAGLPTAEVTLQDW